MLDSKLTLAVNIFVVVVFILALSFNLKEASSYFGDWMQAFK